MTPEMVKLRRRCEILEAIAAGGMVGEIAKRLNVHVSTFYAEVKSHGIAFSARYDGRLERDIESLVVLAFRGFNISEISPILQRPKTWVQRTGKKHGIEITNGLIRQKPSRRDLLAVVSGRTNKQAAGAMGVSISTLWAWMKADGIEMQERKTFALDYFGEDMPEELNSEPAPAPKAAVNLPRVQYASRLGCSAGAINKAVAKLEAARHAT